MCQLSTCEETEAGALLQVEAYLNIGSAGHLLDSESHRSTRAVVVSLLNVDLLGFHSLPVRFLSHL